jgi:hypothetical protein
MLLYDNKGAIDTVSNSKYLYYTQIMKKVVFKIDRELDFKNHLIGAKRILDNFQNTRPEVIEYFKSLRNADEEDKIKIFENETSKFYGNGMKDIRPLLVKQTEEMWDLVEDEYFSKIEKIHQKKFPFKQITGVLSTTPKFYGYDFNKDSPWFACPNDSSLRAIHVTMHEIMHTYFHVYFREEYKNKFKLNDEQIWTIKEALTIILNVELDDMRIYPDKGKPGHEKLREKIKEDWLKYKDINKVLDEACLFIKK